MTWEQVPHLTEGGKAVLMAAGLRPSTGKHLADVLGYTDAEDLQVWTSSFLWGCMHERGCGCDSVRVRVCVRD